MAAGYRLRKCSICLRYYRPTGAGDYRHHRWHVSRGEAVELIYIGSNPDWPFYDFVPPRQVDGMLRQGWKRVEHTEPTGDSTHAV
jgi:hypothetical protein